MKFYIALSYRCSITIMLEKDIHITISLQFQYVIGLHCDKNPTKNRCRHKIACPLGSECDFKLICVCESCRESEIYFT